MGDDTSYYTQMWEARSERDELKRVIQKKDQEIEALKWDLQAYREAFKARDAQP